MRARDPCPSCSSRAATIDEQEEKVQECQESREPSIITLMRSGSAGRATRTNRNEQQRQRLFGRRLRSFLPIRQAESLCAHHSPHAPSPILYLPTQETQAYNHNPSSHTTTRSHHVRQAVPPRQGSAYHIFIRPHAATMLARKSRRKGRTETYSLRPRRPNLPHPHWPQNVKARSKDP